MTVLIVNLDRKFFGHSGGHITHMSGVIEGFIENNKQISLCGYFPLKYQDIAHETYIVEKKSSLFTYILNVFRKLIFLKSQKNSLLYVRYKMGLFFLYPILKLIFLKTPVVVEVNSFIAKDYPWFRFLERFAFWNIDIILCVSDVIKCNFDKLISSSGKSIVIENGVSKDFLPSINSFRKPDWSNIAYFGVIKPDYSIEILIEAVSILKKRGANPKLNIYGDGLHLEKLRKYAHSLGLNSSNCCFHGYIEKGEVIKYMKRSHILVYTQSEKNSFGSSTKISEYFMSSRQIIASRTPHTKKFLKCDPFSDVINEGTAQEFALKIGKLLAVKPVSSEEIYDVRKEKFKDLMWKDKIRDLLKIVEEKNFEKHIT